ncbi:hypothetical protein KFE25_002931 [Diacronema lutheri]|uniref:Uncharacterized protein n=1 Tax=Diacronema lutheri TaxID=2081491 RepID=A0A8J6CAK9_DIALT|nr:hypothetical protein KFE25_002931 [Diacronema lutheri]
MPSPPQVETFTPAAKATPAESTDELAGRQGRTYGKYYAVAAGISFVGYVLTFAIRAATRVWFEQPHLVHGCFGLVWGVILLHQIVTGATRGVHRRLSHRMFGTYVAPFVFAGLMLTGVTVVCLGLTGAGDYYGGHADAHDAVQAYILLHMAAFDSLAFTLAYVAAKRKDFQAHKEMIGFVVMSFGDAGLYRVIVIALHVIAPCGHATISKNKKVVAHVLNRVLLLAVVVPALAKYRRFTRLNIAMLAFFALAEVPVLARVEGNFCAPDQ